MPPALNSTKRREVRAKVRWMDLDETLYLNPCGPSKRVGIIDLSDFDALVEQVAVALGCGHWERHTDQARAVLASLGLKPTNKRGGK